jgi:lysophospholipase L1-like esterase
MRLQTEIRKPPNGRPQPLPGERTTSPAWRVLVAMLVCFLVWGLLDARSLDRSAKASPIGIRRSAALAVLTPLFAVSRVTGLDALGGFLSKGMGRDPNASPGGGISIPPVSSGTGPKKIGRTHRRARVSSNGRHVFYVLPSVRRPSRARPERIVVVGDSFAVGLGFGLARSLDSPLVKFLQQGRESTGLSRADYFNWMNQVRADVARFRPDIVVAIFGGNDNQSVVIPGHSPVPRTNLASWTAAYGRQVADMMRVATSGGARLVWIGLPPTRSQVLPIPAVERMNGIFSSEAQRHPGVLYVDSWHLFAKDDHYAAYLRGPDGRVTQMREGDGVHFTLAGYDKLGAYVASRIRQDLGLKL